VARRAQTDRCIFRQTVTQEAPQSATSLLHGGVATTYSGGAVFCSAPAPASNTPTLEIFDGAAPAGGGDA
jgi:hypothetical protein